MKKYGTLGILVSNRQHFDFALHLANAAAAKCKEVKLHLQSQGAELLTTNDLSSLCQRVKISLCKDDLPDFPPGSFHQISSQVTLLSLRECAEILISCDRCVIF